MNFATQLGIWNRTIGKWKLRPIIYGEFIYGPEIFSGEVNNSKKTYCLMTITSNDKKVTKRVGNFPLLDSIGLLYNLSGAANAPKPKSQLLDVGLFSSLEKKLTNTD
ncbi:hydrocephalus-inducing -like [Brachionus plicatilis]|uniref:Hydrocephalus-inducing-like n=1 Tax=Brachionus plicatilis TaxID=10195 RepID=A0A3M7QY88_BRAPC|nr:hydrocephalus-inducing -like [Brachionus plicatilis]